MKIIEMLEQILLEDLDTEEGGIAYQGETLADFIEYNLEGIEDLQKLEQELEDCGIAPLEQSDKEKIKEYQKPRGGEPTKQKDIVKNLTVMGYQVVWVTYHYWQVPKVNNTILAHMYSQGSTQRVKTDYHLQDIINAIEEGYNDMDEYFEDNYIPF